MTFSLYDATVASYLQTLSATETVLIKSLDHFRQKDIDPARIVEMRLCADMHPLRLQVTLLAHHSWGAIEAARKGLFEPLSSNPNLDYAMLLALLTETRTEIASLAPEVVNGLADRDVKVKIGDREMSFTAERFLVSFSLPNFFFHATTAYDILRQNGAPIGKRDFIGKLRLKE
jgi:uncharacterized protein